MSHTNQINHHHQRSKSCDPSSTTSTWRNRLSPSPPPTSHRPISSSSSTETPSNPSITSTKDNPQQTPRRKNRPNLHRLASLQWSSPFTQTLSPDPRDPYTERSYLMQNLQSQDLRAKRLLSRLTSAEERLAHAEAERTVPGEARRIRKEISLLKAKMAETAHQERLTLLRMSDLYVEIQGRERWSAVQRQKALQGCVANVPQYYYFQVQAPPPPPPPPTAVNGSFPAAAVEPFDAMKLASLAEGDYNSSEAVLTPGFAASLLSPLSPDFVPGSPFAENVFWAKETKEETKAEKDDGGAVDVGGRRPHTPTGSSARSSSVPRSVVSMPFRERRSSVPPPKFTWSDEDADELDVPGS